MDPVTGLAVGRLAVGLTALARPDLAARALGMDAAAPGLRPVSRLFGTREVALGALTLAARGPARRRLVLAGIAVDAADAATGYLAITDRSMSRQTGLGLIAPAVGAALTGLTGLRRSWR